MTATRRLPKWVGALPFLLPGLILFALFVFWPMLQGIRIAFYDWNIMPDAPKEFVGLANFTKAFHDPILLTALGNTLYYWITTVPVQMALGILVALALNSAIRGKVAWRSIYYVPVITSWVIVAYIFLYLFADGGSAPINHIFAGHLHLLPNNVDWLNNRWTAMFVFAVLGVWKGIGWNMMMFLAGLQSIPKDLYEAAAIDGASRTQTFWRITLPLLRPIMFFVLVLLTIGAFNVGIQVQLMTHGGPLDSTQVFVNYLYDNGFRYFKFGYGAAIAVIVAAAISIVTFLQSKYVNNRVEM